jgi:hypothetical protein
VQSDVAVGEDRDGDQQREGHARQVAPRRDLQGVGRTNITPDIRLEHVPRCGW